MTKWRRRAKELIARGANPARAADQAAGGYIVNNIVGWRTHHLLIISAGTGLCCFGLGAIAVIALLTMSGARLASPREAQVLEAVANIEGTILAMPRHELIQRLAVPMKAVHFAVEILSLDASAPPVAPPDWLMRLGQRDRVGAIYAPVPTERATGVKYVVDFLSDLPPAQQSLALAQWAQFVQVGEYPEADNLLWQITSLSFDQRDALMRAGFPPVPNNDEAREVYVKIAHANSRIVTACWDGMKRSELDGQRN